MAVWYLESLLHPALWLCNLCMVGEGERGIFISPGLPVDFCGVCASALTGMLSVPVGSAPALHDAVHPQRALQSPRSWAEKPPTYLFLFNVFPLEYFRCIIWGGRLILNGSN